MLIGYFDCNKTGAKLSVFKSFEIHQHHASVCNKQWKKETSFCCTADVCLRQSVNHLYNNQKNVQICSFFHCLISKSLCTTLSLSPNRTGPRGKMYGTTFPRSATSRPSVGQLSPPIIPTFYMLEGRREVEKEQFYFLSLIVISLVQSRIPG